MENDQEDEKDYTFSEKTLQKILDLTGNGEENCKGFVIFSITEKGNVVCNTNAPSQLCTMALHYAIIKYASQEMKSELF